MADGLKLVEKAAKILTDNGFHREDDVERMVEYLVGFAPFEEMDDDEVEPIVEAALGSLPARRAQPRTGGAGRGQGRGGGGGGGAPTRKVRDDLVPSAPFRFVTLSDTVVSAPRDVALDLPLVDGYAAEIDVEWAAETPLLIGVENDGVVEPMRSPGADGTFVIPGATLRGAIRAAVEIVAHGRLGAANLHHRYGLRDFEHPAYADRSPVSRVGEVKAGWLEWRKGGDGTTEWWITPCDWAHVLIDDLLASRLGRWPTRDRGAWIGKDLATKYDAVDMRRGASFDFTRTFGFSKAPDDNARRMVKPDGPLRGTPVFANKLPGRDGNKKFEYVFFAPSGEPFAIAPEIVATFERLYSKPSKNRPQPDGSWKVLRPTLEKGGRLPVFMVGDPAEQRNGFFFGLTRLFKVPHERSVGGVLFETQPNHRPAVERNADGEVIGYRPDVVESLFGHVVERDELGLGRDERVSPDLAGRKGRVAFSFAHLVSGQRVKLSEPIETVMMAPRASYAPFYLRSSAEKDFSADQPPRLAGRKRYPARHAPGRMGEALDGIRAMGRRQLAMIEEASRGKPVSGDVKSRLRFLLPDRAPDLRFRSTIRMTNVTKAEIGAVLFALTHGGASDGPHRHMIGRARPFGAGQMRVASARLEVKANLPDRKGNEADSVDADHRPFIDAFIDFMRRDGGVAAFPDVAAVREFLAMATPEAVTKLTGRLDYMPLRDFADIRKAVKPKKPDRDGRPADGPHRFPGDDDGRMLPVPTARPKTGR